jgi:hypothetical protein
VGACDSLCILYGLTLVNIVFGTVSVYDAGAHLFNGVMGMSVS